MTTLATADNSGWFVAYVIIGIVAGIWLIGVLDDDAQNKEAARLRQLNARPPEPPAQNKAPAPAVPPTQEPFKQEEKKSA